ncbi:hypothetical protein SAMN04488570_2234 [Nocardioides scoriae]|uniref:O-antigen ligase like membrane protein n=1 Tax=Nocardioides scoriae TaxID=642780 RepID=A0A1H1THV5_9ACTN|nr:hypothetical protein [Nocardioides scoriae]SDS59566.1 hypothetical protein SAMN04488570_2234 [Nocardioides scoriae]
MTATVLAAPDALRRDTLRFVTVIYVGVVLLQRFSVPNQPVALLLPLAFVAAGWGLARGLLEVDDRRLLAWLAASGATALLIPFQSYVLDRELISFTSWGLFMASWLPFVLRLVDRRMATYLDVLRAVVRISVVLAAVCVVMVVSQYAGLAYHDWFADLVPAPLQLGGFVITYPISYDSPIYRANAWIGLEPSMVSLQLGLGLVAALLTGARLRSIALLLAGLVAATSGSGFAILVVALVVMLLSPVRTVLRRFLLPGVAVVLAGLASPQGQSIAGRLGTGSGVDPSLGLRAISPYSYLWPTWSTDLSLVLFGAGPGSSQRLVDRSGILGLLVPTPIKIFFDYGLLAGLVLAAFILVCFVGGPSRTLSLALLISLWTLQPGTTTMVVVIPVLLLVAWWSPRADSPALEDLYRRRRERRRRTGRRALRVPSGDGYADLTDALRRHP